MDDLQHRIQSLTDALKEFNVHDLEDDARESYLTSLKAAISGNYEPVLSIASYGYGDDCNKLIAYWHFDDQDSGFTVFDEVGNYDLTFDAGSIVSAPATRGSYKGQITGSTTLSISSVDIPITPSTGDKIAIFGWFSKSNTNNLRSVLRFGGLEILIGDTGSAPLRISAVASELGYNHVISETENFFYCEVTVGESAPIKSYLGGDTEFRYSDDDITFSFGDDSLEFGDDYADGTTYGFATTTFDQVGIAYPAGLTLEQVQALYNAGDGSQDFLIACDIGGVVAGGESLVFGVQSLDTSGGVVLGGQAKLTNTFDELGAGGVVAGGASLITNVVFESAAGGVLLGGASINSVPPKTYHETGSGGVVICQPVFPNGYEYRLTATVPAGRVEQDIVHYLAVRLDTTITNARVEDSQGIECVSDIREDSVACFWCYLKANQDNVFTIYFNGGD